ncbi:MAG TPA: putative quinol monooxygenase [Candidatus Limnocylindrales bacterium]|nr:putative quinol monooxygenase [Candidatus Limnocylindrales bacterium]
MYGLTGKFTAQPGEREALLGHLLAAASQLRAYEGCLIYIVSRATDDPNGIWVTEVWRSRDDHQGSLALKSTQALIAAARPLIAGMSDRTEFEPVGGKGLPA